MEKSDARTVNIKSEKDRLIWDKLALLAEKHGWLTDAEVSRALGILPQQLGMIKKGHRGFGAKSIRRICERTGVSEKWLLSDGIKTEMEQENIEDLKSQIDHWKEIADNWKEQYQELKHKYDELKKIPPPH